MAYDEETAERVRRILAGRRDVVEKKMMGGLCFMVQGAMCCTVSGKGGMLIRVGAEAMERMLAEPHVKPMEMGARTMAGFVRLAPEGYRTDAALKKWVQRGLDFVATLPAASARKRAARKAAKRP
jgi:TfoX/Sxy family transcriptional regulator of competence genes